MEGKPANFKIVNINEGGGGSVILFSICVWSIIYIIIIIKQVFLTRQLNAILKGVCSD